MSAPSSTALAEPIQLNDEFFADPHALYRVLRDERPVTRAVSPLGLRFWMVTRYADAKAALNDPRLSHDAARLSDVLDRQLETPARRVRFVEELSAHMLNSDPPDHTRLRKLVSRGFTSRAIAALRPRVEAIATELADAMAARRAAGERVLDLIDAFAFPLPMTVISEILGVPEAQRGEFRQWSSTLLSNVSPERRREAATAMSDFLTRLVADKRAHPSEDMLSVIVRASEDADRLSPREAVSMAFLLLIAGHETTVNLIGNGMLTLLRHPEQLMELRADLELAQSAVEEFLRYEGPVNLATFRHTTAPVTLAGVEIPSGEVVLVSLASANRDPAQFDGPDEVNLRREAAHLAFGYGIHHCLGASLARLEGEIAFRVLLSRFPDLSLAVKPSELTWRPSLVLRGLTELPVRLDGNKHLE